MRHHRPIKTMRSWLTETRWMRVLPEPVRERVLGEAHEELHAERALALIAAILCLRVDTAPSKR